MRWSRAAATGPVDVELGPEQRRRAVAGLGRRHPRRVRSTTDLPVVLGRADPVSNQAGSDHVALAADRSTPGPASPPARADASGGPAYGHQDALVAVDPAGVPAVVGADPVRQLPRSRRRAAARRAAAAGRRMPERLVEVLDPQVARGRHGLSRCMQERLGPLQRLVRDFRRAPPHVVGTGVGLELDVGAGRLQRGVEPFALDAGDEPVIAPVQQQERRCAGRDMGQRAGLGGELRHGRPTERRAAAPPGCPRPSGRCRGRPAATPDQLGGYQATTATTALDGPTTPT